jgi:hypothetical protein
MAMKNYKVEQEDGTSTHYQFDESDTVGKEQLRILRAAVKDDDSPVKSVTESDPKPINTGSAK